MEPNSHEALPELPRPEHVDPRIDNIEVVGSPEQRESELPKETLVKASDAVNQAITANNPVANSQVQASTLLTTDDSPAIADDVDVIEKEWVQKAKKIVSDTKDDPHDQSIKINVFKHDYIKKRFGKEIKFQEEQKGR